MQTVPITSTPIHYFVEIARTTLAHGPAILEENEQPVAVLLPMDDYHSFQKWQQAQQSLPPSVPAEFASEVDAFERLRPTLLDRYAGQAVAIYQGRVVAAGDDKMAVYAQVLEAFGPVRCYIEWVEPESPRRVRIVSAWVKQRIRRPAIF